MIYKKTYEIINDKNLKMDYNWGSVMHGLIMEQIKTSYAYKLHESSINPFTQFIYYDKIFNKNYWTINCLNDESSNNILTSILEKNYYLKNKNTEISLKQIENNVIDPKEIVNNNLMTDKDIFSNKFNFVTPTAFKKNGHYLNYPSVFNIYSSLMKRWDTFNDIKIFDYEVLEHIANKAYVKKYNLSSRQFYLEKTKIPSFIGNIEYALPISKELKKICNILNEYSLYSGVGIKCSLGMSGQILKK